MKKLITFIFGVLISLSSLAQNAVIKPGSAPSQESSLSSPEAIYILLMAIVVVSFLFIIVYSLGKATHSLADNLRDHLEK